MTTRPDLVVLFIALSSFLWMFLAAAPLETLADAGGIVRVEGGAVRADARIAIETYRFAADWRHGMTGNSPLYMPGFFLLAVAGWAWSTSTSVRRLVVEGGAMLLASLAITWMCADLARPGIVALLERTLQARIAAPWPDPPVRAVLQGLYTAAAWMTVVAACRRALSRRSFKPLLIVPAITLGLVLVRPWTVDDFAVLWITRAASGDATALVSAIAIPVVAWILVRTEWPSQRVHIHRSDRRTEPDE